MFEFLKKWFFCRVIKNEMIHSFLHLIYKTTKCSSRGFVNKNNLGRYNKKGAEWFRPPFRLGHRQKILSSPFVLYLYGLQNEVSHEWRTFKFSAYSQPTSVLRWEAKLPNMWKRTLPQQHVLKRAGQLWVTLILNFCQRGGKDETPCINLNMLWMVLFGTL